MTPPDGPVVTAWGRSPKWQRFDDLVQRHERRMEREFDEYHDGWLYCWCDDAQAIREAAKSLKVDHGKLAITDQSEP
jgi:hypothetical protein